MANTKRNGRQARRRKRTPELRVLELLSDATRALPLACFQLARAARNDAPVPILRERVYSYELYHQLRSIWPRRFRYALNGEPDKRAHPLFDTEALHNANPDLIVHQPGSMDGNLCVLEIKHGRSPRAERLEDVATLNAFTAEAGYSLGLLLIYGEVRNPAAVFRELAEACGPRTLVWWHREAGTAARPWNAFGEANEATNDT